MLTGQSFPFCSFLIVMLMLKQTAWLELMHLLQSRLILVRNSRKKINATTQCTVSIYIAHNEIQGNLFQSLINTFTRMADLQESVNILSLISKMETSSTPNKSFIKENYIKFMFWMNVSWRQEVQIWSHVFYYTETALYVRICNSRINLMLWMETEWTHSFVSVKMHIFYTTVLFLRKGVAFWSDEALPSPPDQPAQLAQCATCGSRRQEVGKLHGPYKAQSSRGSLCALWGNVTWGHRQRALPRRDARAWAWHSAPPHTHVSITHAFTLVSAGKSTKWLHADLSTLRFFFNLSSS